MTLPTLKQKHDRFRQFLTIFDTRRNVLKFNETIITGNKDDLMIENIILHVEDISKLAYNKK